MYCTATRNEKSASSRMRRPHSARERPVSAAQRDVRRRIGPNVPGVQFDSATAIATTLARETREASAYRRTDAPYAAMHRVMVFTEPVTSWFGWRTDTR